MGAGRGRPPPGRRPPPPAPRRPGPGTGRSASQGLEGPVVVEVVRLDVGQHGASRAAGPGRSRSSRRPRPPATRPSSQAGVGPDLVDVRPDEERRPQAGLHQDQGQHRRGGGLAVGPGHGDAPLGGGHGREHLGPRDDAGIPRRPASTSRRCLGATAGEKVTASTPADVVGPVPDGHRDPLGGQALGDRRGLRSLPVTRWPMAESTVAMALIPAPPTPTTWIRRGRSRSRRRPSGRRPGLSGHGPPPARPPAAPRRGGRARGRRPHGHQARGRQQAVEPLPSLGPSQDASGTTTAAPRSTRARALALWWSPGALGNGTSTAGVPVTASSATVIAPARQTMTSTAA